MNEGMTINLISFRPLKSESLIKNIFILFEIPFYPIRPFHHVGTIGSEVTSLRVSELNISLK